MEVKKINKSQIEEQKKELEKWIKKLEKDLSKERKKCKKQEFFLINKFWYDRYVKYILNINNDLKESLEAFEDLIETNNESYIQFNKKQIDIKNLPKIFVLNKDIWNYIKAEYNQLNVLTASGIFSNKLLTLKVMENIYCLFFLDNKNIIRQGYLEIKEIENENNIIKYFK